MSIPKFTMPFEPTTIEHLGLKLYSSLPRVIGELVSNAWDADAEKVEIIFPTGKITQDSEVIIRDYGKGMDKDGIQNEYLPIGRNCRECKGDDHTEKDRPIMGRKGIGKLSAFGAANELQIRTIQAGKSICIVLNYKDMIEWPKIHKKNEPYEPKVISELTGPTEEKNGTEIRIKQLKRSSPIDDSSIIKDLARRFSIISDNLKNDTFEVHVNDKKISKEDRRLKESCKKYWDAAELPGNAVIDSTKGWEVTGWIGIISKSSQTERGVDVFSRGKVAEIETMFGLKTTHIQFARAYVVGEIHAEFIDGEDDNISTARDSIDWESDAGHKLAEWGQKALKYVFNEWLKLQKEEKERDIIKIGKFDKWLGSRTKHEQKVANKLLKAIVEDEKIEPESAGPLLEIIKTNIEFQAFQQLVDDIEEDGSNVATLLNLFKEWRIIEAREHLKLSDGRLEIIEKLTEFIKEGALEVKEIQPLFEENGWLINAKWTEVSGQNRYTDMIRKHCKEAEKTEEKDRRIDILGYEVGGILHIVELKKPEKTLSRKDLDQIEDYVDWARNRLMGSGPDSPKFISGLLIVGKLSRDGSVQEKQKRLAGSDIRVETFSDLLYQSNKIYGEVEKRLKKIAPEYSREARKTKKDLQQ